MFKCLFCGLANSSEKARFCIECGPDGAAKDWMSEDIDQPERVKQYALALSEYYFDFDVQTDPEVEKYAVRRRERLKISHDTHVDIIAQLSKQKKAIAHLAKFRIEFNENVIDAYTGHDTYLSFRYTNLSEDDLFKISLMWDDPETTDRIDLRAQSSGFVKPQGSVTLGASLIFDRIGIKELTDMQISITDQFGDSANFKAEPFSFRVGSHEQKVTNIISIHNQISIEGRGVVDASGMGAETSAKQPSISSAPKWRDLSFSYVPKRVNTKENAATETKALSKLNPDEDALEKAIDFILKKEKSCPLSKLNHGKKIQIMFGKVNGILCEKIPPSARVNCSGVDFIINVPFGTFYQLPSVGDKVSLLTHTVVKDNENTFFGFGCGLERRTFRELIAIPGVGPKAALSVLSGFSVTQLAQVVTENNPVPLTEVPGIDIKTAQRLVLALKGTLLGTDMGPPSSRATRTVLSDIYSALLLLGCSDNDCAILLRTLPAEVWT